MPDDRISATLPALVRPHVEGRLPDCLASLMSERCAQRLLDNLVRYRAGAPLRHRVDLALGY